MKVAVLVLVLAACMVPNMIAQATLPLAWNGTDRLACSGIYTNAQYCSLTNQFGGHGYCAPNGTADGQSTDCAGGTPGVSQPQAGDQCYSIFGKTYGLYNAAWTPLPFYDGHADNGDRDGIVTGGFNDGRNWTCDTPGSPDHCIEPHLSQTDNCNVHEDRDINIPFLPMLGYDRQFLDWTFLAQDNINAIDGKPAGLVGMEVEWRYIFPTIWSWQYPGFGQTPDDIPVRLDSMPAACGRYSNSGDCAIPLGVPQSGDEIAVRGRPIFDCGHQVFGYGHTEFHPVRGLIWLHPTDHNPSDGMIWLRLLSHEAAPLQDGDAGSYSGCTPKHGSGRSGCEPQVSFGGPMTASFDIPGYPSPTGENLYLGPIKTDWVTDPNDGLEKANTYGGTGTDCGNPWARWVVNNSSTTATAADMRQHPATEIFTITANANNGYVTVTASLNPNRPNETGPPSDLPFIVGAHLQVCYPVCDPNGCQSNNCPGFCKKAASCVTRYAGGITVDNSLTSIAWSGWTGNEELDGAVVGPNMSPNELPTTVSELDVWNSNDSFVPWGPSYQNYTGMIYTQMGNQVQWVVDLAGGNQHVDTHVNIFSDGSPSGIQPNRMWRYNGLTGQITSNRGGWLCLDTLNSDGTTATGVQVESCDRNRASQKWLWSSSNGTSGAFIHVVDRPNGAVSCLSVPSLSNGTQLTIGNCNNSNSQWTFYFDSNAGLN